MGREADIEDYSKAEEALWDKIKANPLCFTQKRLPFKIKIKGNELFVDRRQKFITRASVKTIYKKWLENGDRGSKALGVFGASYLLGVFREIDRSDAR